VEANGTSNGTVATAEAETELEPSVLGSSEVHDIVFVMKLARETVDNLLQLTSSSLVSAPGAIHQALSSQEDRLKGLRAWFSQTIGRYEVHRNELLDVEMARKDLVAERDRMEADHLTRKAEVASLQGKAEAAIRALEKKSEGLKEAVDGLQAEYTAKHRETRQKSANLDRFIARKLKKLDDLDTEIRRMEAVAAIVANETAELAVAVAEGGSS
jgi:chromosome segregation ATPase